MTIAPESVIYDYFESENMAQKPTAYIPTAITPKKETETSREINRAVTTPVPAKKTGGYVPSSILPVSPVQQKEVKREPSVTVSKPRTQPVVKPEVILSGPTVLQQQEEKSPSAINTYGHKRPQGYIGSPNKIIGHNGIGVSDEYFEKNIDAFGKFPLHEYEHIKRMVLNFDFKSVRYILDFGESIQKQYSQLSEDMLRMTSTGRIDIEKYLNEIIVSINSFGQDELLGNIGIFKSISFMMSNISIEDRLKRALNEVDKSVHYIENTIPLMSENVDNLDKIESRFVILDKELHHHIIVIKIILQYFRENSMDSNIKKISDKRDYLSTRLDSLLQSSITGQLTPEQIKLMRNTYVQKIESARNTILSLVASWKSYCSSALSMLESGNRNIGGLVGDIISSRDKILSAIEKSH